MQSEFLRILVLIPLLGAIATAQEVRLRRVEEVKLPGEIDGNSPSFWRGENFRLFSSIGTPQRINEAGSQFGPWETRLVDRTTLSERPIWIEAVWVDGDDTVFGWYHHEPLGLFAGSLLTVPQIGAVVSFDGGDTVHDLGIVLASGDPSDGTAENGAFAGGHGDFTVILDREREYFYFFFSNYGGPPESQGVAVARLAYADRIDPVGKVFKYHQGKWEEPGVGGRVTPILPVRRDWKLPDPDAFWGPAVHWNTYLECHVMLLNRTQGKPGWSQEGIYVCFGGDLARPESWTTPQKILDVGELLGSGQFYPQVIGLEPGGTDRLAGQTARLYVAGESTWEIDFLTAEEWAALRREPPAPPPRTGLPLDP